MKYIMCTVKSGSMTSVSGLKRMQGAPNFSSNLKKEPHACHYSDTVLGQLATCVADTQIEKKDIGWNLEDLENAVFSVLERDVDSDDEDTEE
jgi:hypothetical protein